MKGLCKGRLVLVREHHDFTIAKIDLVRTDGISAFPWKRESRQFQSGRRRFGNWQLAELLPEDLQDEALAELADQFNALRNRRDADRRSAQDRFAKRVLEAARKGPNHGSSPPVTGRKMPSPPPRVQARPAPRDHPG